MYVVKCAACDVFIGYSETMDAVDDLAFTHDRTCTATEEQKHFAALELRLRHFTAQEGLL